MINEIYIKIEGLNLYRIAQKLIDGGVMLSNLKLKKSYILFSIDEKYRPKLDSICKRERKKYYIVKNTKIKRFFAKIPYSLGGFIPFLILFAFFYATYNTIFAVNLSFKADKDYDISKIRQVLLDNNIVVGARKSNLTVKEIEKIILKNADDISGCEVFFEGQNLNIVVFPSIVNNENLQSDLLSKYNAIVTSVEVFAGDAAVKVGSLVQEGDVLIKYNSGAKGEIKGKVYFSTSRIYNEKQDKFVETGRVFESSSLNFANLITFDDGAECGFENYNLEKTSEVVIKNLLIPIVKENYIYREVEIKEEFVPFSSVEENIKNELKQEVLEKLPADTQAEDITYSVVREGSFVRVDCFAEVEISLL